ncbi:MAG TPA: FkbM family methyltransferase [Verrucomicrobiae bacterium]|nr:FkbM family methyltransferase [Verrucomicrobiae bacterium]
MNHWLDSTVKNYLHYFGETQEPVVWEVGSRDGDDGVELAKRIYSGTEFWVDATIVALEPNPDQVEVIKERHPEVQIFEVAASNAVGRAPFMVYHGDEGAVGSSSLNLRWKGDDLEGHVIHVETNRLEHLIGSDSIDIMKIDVEGHSLQVLEGLADKLKQIKVMHIETEEWTGSNKEVEKYMKSCGWTLVDVMEQYGGMPDQVWINSAILAD